MNLQCFAIVALAFTHFTGYIHIGQEVHLDFDDTLTLTSFTTSSLYIEGEAPRCVTSDACLRDLCEEFTDAGEGIGVGSRVRARCASDRRLIDVDNLVQICQALDILVCSRLIVGAEKGMGEFPIENISNQCTFARARYTCHSNKLAEGYLNSNVLEIVLACALDHQGVPIAIALVCKSLDT